MQKEEFDNLIKRLKYWNESEDGINSHGTDSPVFTVQSLERIYGFDLGYSDKWVIIHDDSEFDTVKEALEILESDDLENLCNLAEVDSVKNFHFKLNEYDQISCLEEIGLGFNKVYYNEDWKHVNTHLTREAAQSFIDRKKHDYVELRIWVDSLYWCWEFKAIVKGLVSGDIILKEKC